MDILYRKPVLNASLEIFDVQICRNTFFKTKNSPIQHEFIALNNIYHFIIYWKYYLLETN